MKPSSINAILAKTSEQAAPLLVGCRLRRKTRFGAVELKIVETEAYHQSDPASHSFSGLTKRTAPMFMAGGRIYVYISYGLHYCINIVTGPRGVGEGVLLRAAQPLDGVEAMQRLRGQDSIYNLASGPGKLAGALDIKDTTLSGAKIGSSTIDLLPPEEIIEPNLIVAAPRIGISKGQQLPWRFYLKDNPFISKK